MPAFVHKRGNRFRVVHRQGRSVALVKRGGKPVDGGGHRSKTKALRQARAINARR